VNIAKVAAEAGVGVGTVSRVLNGSPQVRDATRRRIVEVIDRLGYRPSHLAASLSLGATRAVAVLVPFLTRPSVVARLAGVLSVLDEEGYDSVVFNIETPEQRDRHLASVSTKHRADGVVVISIPLVRDQLAALEAANLPMVMLDADTSGAVRFVVDNVKGGRMATEHLLALGHRRIGFIGDDTGSGLSFTSSGRRLAGYRAALAAAGIGWCPEIVALGPHGAEDAARMATGLLSTGAPPTAICAASDTQAMGVLTAAERLGLAVPDDLSVIGFDDIDSAAMVRLSTVRQPLQDSGVLAARRLCDQLQGRPRRPARTVLPLELVARASTGAVDCRGRPPPTRRTVARTDRRRRSRSTRSNSTPAGAYSNNHPGPVQPA
jgi:DNA-binding LacI/PurR family transcriptional regulator